MKILAFEAQKFGFNDTAGYFRDGIFAGLISNAVSNTRAAPDFMAGSTPGRLLKYRTQADIDAMAFYRYDLFLYPILARNEVVGWYGGRINVQLIGDEIKKSLIVSLALLVLSLAVFLVLMFNVGDIIIGSLNELTSWSESIGRGDFSEHKKPLSHDEIEKLADQFDRMRVSLSNNVHNLKINNLIITKLQTVSSVNDMFNVFLTFVTANFGFQYNRGAIFLKEESKLTGKYAIGCLDEKELQRTFGGYKSYINLQIDINTFIEDTRPFMDNATNNFTMAVREIVVMPEDHSILWDTMKNRKPLQVAKSTRLENPLDTILRRRLNLEDFAVFPLYKGREAIGVMIVDNYFDKKEITPDQVDQLRAVVSEFSLNLENVYLVGNLEQIVHERTGRLEREMQTTEEQRKKLDSALTELNTAYTALKDRDKVLMDDLSMARMIQDKILKRDLDKVRDLNYSIISRPASEVGGDVYDIADIGNRVFRVFLAKSPGRGVQAALFTMIVKSEYEKLKLFIKNPAELMELLNNEFFRIYKSLHVFFSCIVVDIDLNGRKITYSSAGHPVQYIYKNDDVVNLSTRGKMIGVQEDIKYIEESVAIEGKLKVILFTEGLVKLADTQGTPYQTDRMHALVRENRLFSIQRITDRIEEDVEYHARNAAMDQDITIVGIEI